MSGIDQDKLTLIREIKVLRDENLELKKRAKQSKLSRKAFGFAVYCSRSKSEPLAEAAKEWMEKYNETRE